METLQLERGEGLATITLNRPKVKNAMNAELWEELSRVLRPGGGFLSISLASPRRRLAHLTRPEWGWSATVHTVPKKRTIDSDDPEANVNWVYVLSRR